MKFSLKLSIGPTTTPSRSTCLEATVAKPNEVGTRFPFINLEKALIRAEQLYQADPRGRALAVATAFAAWGYSDKSSGGHQTVAALKLYGLITDTGANAERRIGLTREALHYFADERADERAKALRRFALLPKLINAIWQQWDGSPPPDNVARSQLKIDRKLNEQSARSFLSIYKDNLAFADLKEASSAKTIDDEKNFEDEAETFTPEPIGVGDFVQWSPGGIDQFPDPPRVRGISPDGAWLFIDGSETGIPRTETQLARRGNGQTATSSMAASTSGKPPTLPLSPTPTDIKRDVFSLDEGEVTITFPSVLSQASYNDLVDWLELVKRKAERAIRSNG